MEMHQVRYSLAVARTLNFTRAAEECHVAQPSLTRAVKQLEAELGGELFRRERNFTHLTEFGQRMMPLLQQCFDSAQAAKDLAKSIQTGAISPFSVAISRTISIATFVPHLKELTRALNGLELRFIRGSRDEVLEYLRKGDAELAIAGNIENTWERLDAWPLFKEGFKLAVSNSHPLAERDSIDPSELAGQRLLLRTYCELTDMFTEFLAARQIKPLASHRMASEHDYVTLIESGLAIGMLPDSAPASEAMRRIRLDGPSLDRTIQLYAVAGRQRSPAASLFMRLLRAADWTAAIAEPPSQMPACNDAAE